jgi:hypothetical protein
MRGAKYLQNVKWKMSRKESSVQIEWKRSKKG